LGRFCWHEFVVESAPDEREAQAQKTAAAFAALFDWKLLPFPMTTQSNKIYYCFSAAKLGPHGGMADASCHGDVGESNKEMLAGNAGVLAYVRVESVEETLKRAVELGAKKIFFTESETTDVLGAFQDPLGAVVGLFQDCTKDASMGTRAHHPGKHAGEFCWHEVLTPDVDATIAFYSAVFPSWKRLPNPSDESGAYVLLGQADNSPDLGVMKTPEELAKCLPGACLNSYVSSDDIEGDLAKLVEQHGYTALTTIMAIPKVGRFATVASDNTGTWILFQKEEGQCEQAANDDESAKRAAGDDIDESATKKARSQ
jgi:predicted enzyme related to lactoylglutathione lyase